jgi:hypothetical protein
MLTISPRDKAIEHYYNELLIPVQRAKSGSHTQR